MAPEVSRPLHRVRCWGFLILTHLVAFASVFLVGFGREDIAKRPTLGSIKKPKRTGVESYIAKRWPQK